MVLVPCAVGFEPWASSAAISLVIQLGAAKKACSEKGHAGPARARQLRAAGAVAGQCAGQPGSGPPAPARRWLA